jgi:hypothetical protein
MPRRRSVHTIQKVIDCRAGSRREVDQCTRHHWRARSSLVKDYKSIGYLLYALQPNFHLPAGRVVQSTLHGSRRAAAQVKCGDERLRHPNNGLLLDNGLPYSRLITRQHLVEQIPTSSFVRLFVDTFDSCSYGIT